MGTEQARSAPDRAQPWEGAQRAASRCWEGRIRALRSSIFFPFAHFHLQSFVCSQVFLPGS